MARAPLTSPARPTSVWVAVVGCVTLAAALRFIGLRTQSLWIDEIYSAEMTRWPLTTILEVQDGHPPLFALIHVLVAHWVDADLAGRLIAATAGVLAVGLFVQLASELFGLRVGVLAGLLLACSPLHVWYSQEGRSYALVVLIAIASSAALVRAMRHASPVAWVCFAVLSLVGLLTHYLYVGMVLAQVVFLAIAGGQGRLLLAVGIALAAGAACIPILGPETMSFVGDQRGFEWLALPYTGFTFIAGFGLGPSVEALHRERDLGAIAAAAWPAITAVGLLVLAGVVALPRAIRRAGRFGWYALAWALVPIVVAFAGSWARNGAFNVRYAIAALPGVVLCMALVLAEGSTRRCVAGLAALLALSLTSIARDRLEESHRREDVRGTARWLETALAPTDRVVLAASYMDFGFRHYLHSGPKLEPLPIHPVRSPADAAADVRDLRSSDRPTWLVLVREWEDDPNGYLAAALADRGAPRPYVRFAGVRIFRMTPETP